MHWVNDVMVKRRKPKIRPIYKGDREEALKKLKEDIKKVKENENSRG